MEKTSFSNNNSLALKGVAIIMMMFHHCFRATHLFEDFDISFYPFSQNLIVEISLMFKICVSIFVFVTGYGLTISLKKSFPDYNWNASQIGKWTINRLIKLLSGFWFVAIIAYIVCQIVDGRTSDVFFDDGVFLGVSNLIVDFLGLTHLLGLSKFNSTWWYMSIASIFVVVLPIIVKSMKRYSTITVVFFFIVVPRLLNWKYVDNSFISFSMPLILGVVFAEKNLMIKISNLKVVENYRVNKLIKFVIGIILIYITFRLYRVLPNQKFWEIKYGIIPVVIICFLYEFLLDLPIAKDVLQFLGKHSMNVFLVHTFIRLYYLNDFTYSFKHFILIAIVLLSISIVVSIVIDFMKKITKYDYLIGKLQKMLASFLDEKGLY